MAPNVVNSGQALQASGTSVAFTPGWTPTVGNYYVAVGVMNGVANNPTCSDTVNGAYTRMIQSYDAGFVIDVGILYVKITSTTVPTITFASGSPTAQKFTLDVLEVSGLDPTTPFTAGQSATNTGTSTSPSTGSLTNSTANAIFIGAAFNQDTGNPGTLASPGAPWTVAQSNTNGVGGVVGSTVYQVVSSTGAENPGWTTNNYLWVGAIVAMNGAGDVTIPVNDANVFFSPGGWVVNGSTNAQCYCSGNYVKLGFTGTSISVDVDVSVLSGASASMYPVLIWRVYDATTNYYGAWNGPTQLTSASTNVSLASGLTSGTYQIELIFHGVTGNPGIDRWNASATPYLAFRITDFKVDPGAASAAPTLRPKRMFWYGDSITEGFNADATLTGAATNNLAGFYDYARAVAIGLDAEYGIGAYGAQKLCTTTGTINVPGLCPATGTGTYDHIDASTARTLTGFDYFGINIGNNDNGVSTGATITAQMTALLSNLYTANPTAYVFAASPFSQNGAASYIDAATVNGSRQKIFNFDTLYPDDKLSGGLGAGGGGLATFRASDNLHPRLTTHAEIAARWVDQAQAAISGGSGGNPAPINLGGFAGVAL